MGNQTSLKPKHYSLSMFWTCCNQTNPSVKERMVLDRSYCNQSVYMPPLHFCQRIIFWIWNKSGIYFGQHILEISSQCQIHNFLLFWTLARNYYYKPILINICKRRIAYMALTANISSDESTRKGPKGWLEPSPLFSFVWKFFNLREIRANISK